MHGMAATHESFPLAGPPRGHGNAEPPAAGSDPSGAGHAPQSAGGWGSAPMGIYLPTPTAVTVEVPASSRASAATAVCRHRRTSNRSHPTFFREDQFVMHFAQLKHCLLPALAATALAVPVSLAVAACGGSGTDSGAGTIPTTSTTATSSSTSSTTPTGGQHNEADVAFATGMIPHHRQAIAMAEMAQTRAQSSRVKSLAARVKAAQVPEITQMSGWLKAWGQPVPTGSGMGSHMGSGTGSGTGSGMPSMDRSGTSASGMTGAGSGGMAGMMSEEDMSKMGTMFATAFDRAFLTGMVAHHRGAVAMAQTELRQGGNAEAKQLAQSIIDSQNAEIDEMTQLLRHFK